MRIHEYERQGTLKRFVGLVEGYDLPDLERLYSEFSHGVARGQRLLGDHVVNERALTFLKNRIRYKREQKATAPTAEQLMRKHNISRGVAERYVKRRNVAQAPAVEPALDERAEAQNERQRVIEHYEGKNGTA
jgi:hypothetical protein